MNAQGKDRVVLLDGARTPVGRFLGALKDVPAHELGGTATRAALSRADVAPNQIGEVVMGCIGQVGKDAFNARRVAFAADIPSEVPSYTVNRLCGSGLQAVWSAAMQLREGEIDFAVAGGDESMSRMPFYDFDARDGRKLGDRALHDGTLMMLTDPFRDIPMGVTAENVAAKYDVSREAQDQFAAESQRRATTADAQAAFADEIVPVQTAGRRPSLVVLDEHPRPETTVESLAALRPSFDRSGTVTAGNSSGINDGAAAVVLAREEVARRRGHERGLVALEAVATAAIKPELMGYAPVLALQRLFTQTGTAPNDVDVIELNEAFAAQAVAVIRGAGLPEDRTNPYGGAIALGHPVGATGAILAVRVMKDLIRRDGELGIVTMCIGGGQALAALLRRLN
ncbi:thiolase family protein [Brevibacterium oceani]|uniref:thiolase family protein n=1 Tax=Brevibacterium oceani TaxID=358099 RepID=UPI001B32DBFB|nr:thiolase family protein [Brevibacterium oceani]